MNPQDMQGLGKVLDSKTVAKLYEDAAQPASRQVGAFGEDTLKTIRLFAAPLQVLASLQDRFERWLNEVAGRVPEERRVSAPANVAGPVLTELAVGGRGQLPQGNVLEPAGSSHRFRTPRFRSPRLREGSRAVVT